MDCVQGTAKCGFSVCIEVGPLDGIEFLTRIPIEGEVGQSVVNDCGRCTKALNDLRNHAFYRIGIPDIALKCARSITERRAKASAASLLFR